MALDTENQKNTLASKTVLVGILMFIWNQVIVPKWPFAEQIPIAEWMDWAVNILLVVFTGVFRNLATKETSWLGPFKSILK